MSRPAVGDVQGGGLDLAADEQHGAGGAGLDEAVGGGQAVDEAGALVADVHGAGGVQFQQILDEDPVAGEETRRGSGWRR